MKILAVLGRHNYGRPERGEGYEFTNFIPAFRRLGHDVSIFESLDKSGFHDFAELNRKFLETVDREKPDIIFCVLMNYELWIETLELVRMKTNAVTVNWATDDSWKYEQFSKFMIPHVHIHATTYPEALIKSKRCGYGNVVMTQWAANAETLARPLSADQCSWDVSFVGMAYGNRPQWISALEKRGINVACFGYGWPNGPVTAERIPEIVRKSVINLNFGDSDWVIKGLRPVRNRQIKARVFEVTGCGGFLMTEKAENLETFFEPGKEIVLFEDVEDLLRKINFFLKNPKKRDAIAFAGHDRTVRDHTYDKRFKTLLGEAAKDKARQSKEAEFDSGKIFEDKAFEKLARRHRPGPLLQMLRIALVAPCRLIWGKKRGARAARRILFELSWRIAREKTYSASGWPGRLFHKES